MPCTKLLLGIARNSFRWKPPTCTRIFNVFISPLEGMELFTIHLPVTNAVEARTQAKIRKRFFFADGYNRTDHAAADVGKRAISCV